MTPGRSPCRPWKAAADVHRLGRRAEAADSQVRRQHCDRLRRSCLHMSVCLSVCLSACLPAFLFFSVDRHSCQSQRFLSVIFLRCTIFFAKPFNTQHWASNSFMPIAKNSRQIPSKHTALMLILSTSRAFLSESRKPPPNRWNRSRPKKTVSTSAPAVRVNLDSVLHCRPAVSSS
jgi:hypothetical protein